MGTTEAFTLIFTVAATLLGIVLGQLLSTKAAERGAEQALRHERLKAREAALRDYRERQTVQFYEKANLRMKLYGQLCAASRIDARDGGRSHIKYAIIELEEGSLHNDFRFHGILNGTILAEPVGRFLEADQRCDMLTKPYVTADPVQAVPTDVQIRVNSILMDALAPLNRAFPEFIAGPEQ